MDIELVTIGTELVLGFTIDTNGATLAQLLAPLGIQVVRRTAVPDTPAVIRDAVREALERTKVVITTGGLGPTTDDLSKEAVAGVFGVPLEFHQGVWDRLVERYQRLLRKMPDSNRSQAYVPKGAAVLPNQWGSAPGLWLEGEPGLVIMLPGVPHEATELAKAEVVPRLAARVPAGRVVASRTLRTAGIAESSLADRLGPLEDGLAPVALAYLPGTSGVDLRLTVRDISPDQADRLLSDAAGTVRGRLGDHCFGEGSTTLAQALLERAGRCGKKLALAESCTGGLVGELLTAVPGSSSVFLGGVVAYHNAAKERLLGVPAEVLARHGAVSEESVLAMVRGAGDRFGADIAAAVTGIAGPDGGTEEKPVGTVWLGYLVDGRAEASRRGFSGTREEIRQRAAAGALFGLLRRLRG